MQLRPTPTQLTYFTVKRTIKNLRYLGIWARRVSPIIEPHEGGGVNVDSSFNILDRLLKLSVGILDILMEGTVSQIFYLSPSSSLLGPAIPKMMIKDFRKCFLSRFFDTK